MNQGRESLGALLFIQRVGLNRANCITVTPIRTILYVLITREEAQEFANTFVIAFLNSEIQFT